MRYALPALALLLAASAAAWLWRYDTLPPFGIRYITGPTETVIVCTVDRWTRVATCLRRPVIELSVPQPLGPFVPHGSPLHPSNTGK